MDTQSRLNAGYFIHTKVFNMSKREIYKNEKKNMKTIEIQEDVKISGTDIILEAGDRIEVLKEDVVQDWDDTLADYIRESMQNGTLFFSSYSTGSIDYSPSTNKGLDASIGTIGRETVVFYVNKSDSMRFEFPQKGTVVTIYEGSNEGFKLYNDRIGLTIWFFV